MINVQVFDISGLKEEQIYVSDQNKEEVKKYFFEKDRLRFLSGRALIKKLNPSPYYKGKNGKPYFKDGPYFNLSYSENKVVLVSCWDFECGIDIEFINQMTSSFLKNIFSDNELNEINKTNRSLLKLMYWVKKEAVLKTCGVGLISNMKDIDCIGSVVNFYKKDYYLKQVAIDEYFCFVCTPLQDVILNIDTVNMSELFKKIM
jgi:phosphopantetheinyl transferase